MAELLVQYSTSSSIVSTIIRRLTHSRWSHVDILIPGEGLLGSSCRKRYENFNDPGGVYVRPFHPWPYRGDPKVATIHAPYGVVRRTIEWARAQKGTPYDTGALLHFLRDRVDAPVRDWRDGSAWFCSEFVIRAAEVGGLFKPHQLAVAKDTISPNDTLLLFNPFLSNESALGFMEAE